MALIFRCRGHFYNRVTMRVFRPTNSLQDSTTVLSKTQYTVFILSILCYLTNIITQSIKTYARMYLYICRFCHPGGIKYGLLTPFLHFLADFGVISTQTDRAPRPGCSPPPAPSTRGGIYHPRKNMHFFTFTCLYLFFP